jgi:hypothetical protein
MRQGQQHIGLGQGADEAPVARIIDDRQALAVVLREDLE